ncbi:hypothetical protein N0V90_001057 [Kalmusia sp. IMI 367209]|nr:hypothetical protein N0V90_001057 [Kalmusia sp. IMI 367209]
MTTSPPDSPSSPDGGANLGPDDPTYSAPQADTSAHDNGKTQNADKQRISELQKENLIASQLIAELEEEKEKLLAHRSSIIDGTIVYSSGMRAKYKHKIKKLKGKVKSLRSEVQDLTNVARVRAGLPATNHASGDSSDDDSDEHNAEGSYSDRKLRSSKRPRLSESGEERPTETSFADLEDRFVALAKPLGKNIDSAVPGPLSASGAGALIPGVPAPPRASDFYHAHKHVQNQSAPQMK